MARVYDVAQYILERQGEIPAIKLQKLVYYCQAWALVWIDRPLFPEWIEAWANGPVVPTLYARHRMQYAVSPNQRLGNSCALESIEKEVVDAILGFYGDKSSHYLIELTHMEDPWRKARERAGALPGERCSQTITHDEMAEYYSTLIQ